MAPSANKFDAFTYSQLYARYDSVLQILKTERGTTERAKQLQRDAAQIRAAMHAKTQERIAIWNGTPSAKDTACTIQTDHGGPQDGTDTIAEKPRARAKLAASSKSHTGRARRSLPKKLKTRQSSKRAKHAKSSTSAASVGRRKANRK